MYVPGVAELHETVAVRDASSTVAGEMGVQVSPEGRELSDKVTGPAKPPVTLRVIVDIALVPVVTESGDVAVRPKSRVSYETVIVIVTR